MAAVYQVNLYLDGKLIGDCRRLAQNLTWTRRRTKVGADSIDFTINDVLFDKWCRERNVTINDLLKPLALECRVVRDGVAIVGGFLATMPGYSPLQRSANLALRFDGFLNLLDGVFIRNAETGLPRGLVSGFAGEVVAEMIEFGNSISKAGGKSYGFKRGSIEDMPIIQHTFDNYETIKEWICNRCDNITGAGAFDVFFHPDKTYDVVSDAKFGDIIHDWVAYYPALQNNASVSTISASEVDGFASMIIGLGAGETSADPNQNTVLMATAKNDMTVRTYGYYEMLYQDSSISVLDTLTANMNTSLAAASAPIWQPQITLHGKHVAPAPTGSHKIWIGDTITINNSIDLTGMTNGKFRVNELAVEISAAGNEVITPVLERASNA